MKHPGDANGADSASTDAAFQHLDAHAGHPFGEPTAAVPDASLLFSGSYRQSGQDLIIAKPFETVTVHDYFRYDVKPALVAPDGSSLSPAVVLALTEGRPGLQYAGDEPARATAIGRVETATGEATVIRNGQTIALHAGDLVFKGDAVATGEHGTLAITFIDGTAFTLAESARMVLNDMVYQPGGSNNSSLLSLVQGSITFVAGEVAHTGEMKVDTPVATMGIRGTAVHVNISAHDGPTRFSVMREPDGRVGSYILYDHKSGAELATVSEVGTVVELQLNNGQIVINAMPKSVLDFQQEQALSQQVFSAYQAGQQDSLLKALMQTHDPSNGGSHGSSGPPQTGPSGGQSEGPSGDQPSQGTPNPTTPQPFQPAPPAPSHPTDDGQPPPLPIVAPAAPVAPAETIVLAKNEAVESALPIPSETVTIVQPANGNAVYVSANGTTIAGLYGHLTIAPDGSFSYVADHAAALGAGALGFDVFNYTVANTNGSTATAALTFDVVGASNNPIVAAPVTAGTMSEQSPVKTINLLSGATDPNPNETVGIATDGSGHPAVQVNVVSGPINANAVLFSVDASGHLTIDPSQFSGLSSTQSETLSFSYTLTNASGGATPQTATITIDAAPSVTYGPAGFGIGVESPPAPHSTFVSEAPTVTSVTGDLVNLDVSALQAQGWTLGTDGTYTKAGLYGIATLVSNGIPYGTSNVSSPTIIDSGDDGGSEIITLASVNFGAPVNGEISYQLMSTLPVGVEYDSFTVPYIDSLGAVVYGTATFTDVNLTPSITAPATATIGVGQTATISGINLAEPDSTDSEIFSVSITDTHGDLLVTGSGGTVFGNGTSVISISGITFTQLNSYLASLTDTDSTPGSDSIILQASDSFGDVTSTQTISVTINGPPTIAAPSAQIVASGQPAAITGISVAESGDTSGETFSATISDTNGLLSVTGSGGTVSGAGTTSLSITGVTLAQLNTYLASLSDTDTTPDADRILLNASDSFGNSAAQQTIGINGGTTKGGWTGDTLQEVYYFPYSTSVYFTPPTFSVPATGVEGESDRGGAFYLSVSSTSITAANFQFSSYWTTASFNGFEITDLSGNPEISGVTIDASSNMVGLTASDISFTSNTVTVNWEGLSFNTSTIVKLDITFDPPLDPSQVSVAQTLDGSQSLAVNKNSLSVSDGTALMLIGAIANFSTIAVNGAHASTAIGLDGNVTLEGGGHIDLSQSNENYIFGSGTLTNTDNVISGGGDIGNGTLVIHNAGTIEAEGPYALIVDTGANPFVNTGLLETNGGTLIVDSSATGGGHALINGGTLEFTAASDNDVSFGGGTGMLALDQSQHFTGTISGFANRDQVDLGDIGFSANTALSYIDNGSNGGTLSIGDGAHTASIALQGTYLASSFTLASDGHGGTLLTTDTPIDGASSSGGAATTTSEPVIGGLSASVESDGGDGNIVTLTGQAMGSDDTGTIAWDQGAAAAPLTLTNGVFSASQDLTPGDHLATLTFNDAATNTKAVQTVDLDIASDAPFVFAPATSPAVLVGSASANVAQTLTGSAAYRDTIVAGAGNDTLTGNYTGGDTFVFKTNMGNDQITDLHIAGLNGSHDILDVSAFHFANYQALVAVTTTDTNGDATIALGTHTLTLDHVQKADLQSDLFHL